MGFTHEQIPEAGIELLKEHGIEDEAVFQRGDWVADKEQGIYLVLTGTKGIEESYTSTYCLLFEEYTIYFDVKTYRVAQEPVWEGDKLIEKGSLQKDILIYDMPKELLSKDGVVIGWIKAALSAEDKNYDIRIHRNFYMYKKIYAGMGFVYEMLSEEGIQILKNHGITNPIILEDWYWIADKEKKIYIVLLDFGNRENEFLKTYGMIFKDYCINFTTSHYWEEKKAVIYEGKEVLKKGVTGLIIPSLKIPIQLKDAQDEILETIERAFSESDSIDDVKIKKEGIYVTFVNE